MNWVVVDRLTKSAHFLPIHQNDSLDKLVELYVSKIVRLHGIPTSIVSDRDPRLTSHFWGSLQRALGAKLHFSTAFHPQTDGQSERTIQTLEDMMRACVIELRGNWDDHLPLMEFAYNNNFHSSIGPELVQQMVDKIQTVKKCLKAAQDRQKSYADKHRREMEYEVGEKVFLKVSPWRGILRFEIEVSEGLTYVEEPIEILDRNIKKLRNKEKYRKVSGLTPREATWEVEANMKEKYHIYSLSRGLWTYIEDNVCAWCGEVMFCLVFVIEFLAAWRVHGRAFQKSLSWLRRKQACVIHNPTPRFSSPFMAERSPIAPSIDKPIIVRVSNSAGLYEYDPNGRKAGAHEDAQLESITSAQWVILFTDIVYGNRTGFFMILPEPLSLAEEPLIGRNIGKTGSHVLRLRLSTSYTWISIVEELKTKKILVRHVEKATNSEDTFDVLRSFGNDIYLDLRSDSLIQPNPSDELKSKEQNEKGRRDIKAWKILPDNPIGCLHLNYAKF
ncbi:UNVERIFIED_CONTAM: Transposon Ty3-I Gag-Pol polyprotein [Sesamum calycinum]|uniref:Transposon Ty3-I Gag-Pol polyprotein n=1 Tax=Sesamum calycinum TaxID=2727403 RepID=A0AAW2LBM7_9LAMI